MRTRIIIGVVVVAALLMIVFLVVNLVGNDGSQQTGAELLRSTFTDATCANSCWMGIKVGVTNETALTAILDARSINYVAESNTYTLNLVTTDSRLWRGVNVPLASIHLDEDRVVRLMTIPLNLCVSRVTEAFGEPEMIIETNLGEDFDLYYPDSKLIFSWRSDSSRIDYIHLEESPLFESVSQNPDNLTWSDVSDRFQGDCVDAFS